LILSQIQFDCLSMSIRRGGCKFRALRAIMRGLVASAALWTMIFAADASFLHAQTDEGGLINREYAIKAAYLYQFGHYIQWPADSFADEQSPFVIGVLGADPFGDALEEIARDKKIAGRPIVIERFASIADYKPCHILFVSSSASSGDKSAAIQKRQPFPVLLVGESPGFAEQGGTIDFIIEANRVRFEVNMEVAKREQLKISSKLLSLAKIIGSP